MSTPRQNIGFRFIRTVAVLMTLLLGQTLAAALLHTVLVDHIWCETHLDFEHVDEESGDTEEHAELEDLNLEAQPGQQHQPGEEPPGPDNLCFYLTSLHGPAIPLPSIHASLLNLPPPTDAATNSPTPGDATSVPRQIDTLHESPGLSPPQRMA
ncbi:hypothetical protein DFR33_11312 [Bradymonas sediminis]|nr:hypothetical protein DFR33_11312 [Bradymonas sediminis]